MSANYHEYLKSPEWQVVRRLAHEQAAGRCQICNQPGSLNVHHRTYERLGNELLSDVTVLCRPCHAKHHDKLPEPPRRDPVEPDVVPDDGPPLPISASEDALQRHIFGWTPAVGDIVRHNDFGEVGFVKSLDPDTAGVFVKFPSGRGDELGWWELSDNLTLMPPSDEVAA